ncbi:MAG: hypothetical protein NXI21_01380 [Alphaproteobacteria bacterium]|nr:hypothetical protein [Alphaproteobacteria bacterium]
MNPTLEAVLFATPTIALNLNRLSRSVTDGRRLFGTQSLNHTIIFKYPNFDVAQDAGADSIPGLDDFIGETRTNKAIRTAIFVPKDEGDLRLGGFGLYTDDEKFEEMSERYLGFHNDSETAEQDNRHLAVLDSCPSFDPFLLKEAFDLEGLEVDQAYLEISESEAAEVRHLIQTKLKPIVAKALGITNEGKLEKSSRQFLDEIWDPQAETGAHFIAAFGIEPKDAPKVFSAWKGVAYFDNEFNRRQGESRKMVKWLKSDLSLPSDYPKLTSHEKQQFEMFRRSVTNKVLNVSNNISVILSRYHGAYDTFIGESNPREFQGFLMGADRYYWTLGGCNGVLAQVLTTWRRYMQTATGGRLGYDKAERLMKVCDAILRARSDEKQIAL